MFSDGLSFFCTAVLCGLFLLYILSYSSKPNKDFKYNIRFEAFYNINTNNKPTVKGCCIYVDNQKICNTPFKVIENY